MNWRTRSNLEYTVNLQSGTVVPRPWFTMREQTPTNGVSWCVSLARNLKGDCVTLTGSH
ncbi:hypothetical protein SCLCIDRAFT_947050 [Scleroderma citrinum Foug A]|uniref:Uncharacterized protein n=1 Tax=Scleroderma citrinum Foug A TaxID=1036808 RepID=A0A0C3DWU9_9AGAM|nr:hypothetical protein SCLCIDRAFT_947050 [Scleroderma citrinum Foug A]